MFITFIFLVDLDTQTQKAIFLNKYKTSFCTHIHKSDFNSYRWKYRDTDPVVLDSGKINMTILVLGNEYKVINGQGHMKLVVKS